jgi:hypothetical protein
MDGSYQAFRAYLGLHRTGAASEPPAASSSVSIELPCGLRVTGLDAASAAIVVRLLREAGP